MPIEKMNHDTFDLTQQNIARVARLFPECVTEGHGEEEGLKVDFDLLRQALSGHLVEGPAERFRLDWPGKRQALLAANSPVEKTFRPMPENESVNFWSARNLFIEGDNLDALKLLLETYLGKVKLIYIDPPYNTGNDFIYKDDFASSREDHEKASGQRDDELGRLVANPETSGRFHSDWLSMMYPRLKVARSLLSDDGVIFVSISDREFDSLSRIMKEIFGEGNQVGTIVWNNVTDNNPTNIASEHEYIIAFSRSRSALEREWKSGISVVKEELVALGRTLVDQYGDTPELRTAYNTWFRENRQFLGPLDRYKYIDADGVYTGSQSVHNPGREGYRYDVIHPDTGQPCKQPLLGYRFPKETMEQLLEKGKILFGDDHNKIIELKVYAKDYKDKLSSVLKIDGRTGAYDLRGLFTEDVKVFDNPKPVSLIKTLLDFGTNRDSVVLDFFAGSGTTGEAVFRLNGQDGGARQFIVVQIPEAIDDKSRATLADTARERIRRAGAKMLEEHPELKGKLDVGFRAFRIDSGNFNDTRVNPKDATQEALTGMVSHIKADRTAEDLLFGALLSWGVDITLPIERRTVEGHELWFVDAPPEGEEGAAVIACFDRPNGGKGGIDTGLADAIAAMKPLRALFRDDGFATDAVKENVASRFKQRSPDTTLRVL